MKSREEYEASIYAKKDALIEKRKKNIRMAAATLSVVICLGAAAVALPAISDSATEADSMNNANSQSQKVSSEDVAEYFTFAQAFGETSKVNGALSDEGYTAVYDNSISTNKKETQTEIAFEEEAAADSEENEGYFEDGFSFNGNSSTQAPHGGAELSPGKSYEAAYAQLTDEEKAEIDESKTMTTVSRNADGSGYFTVYFSTDEKMIIIKVDSETYEFIERTEKQMNGSEYSLPYSPTTQPPENGQ